MFSTHYKERLPLMLQWYLSSYPYRSWAYRGKESDRMKIQELESRERTDEVSRNNITREVKDLSALKDSLAKISNSRSVASRLRLVFSKMQIENTTV